MWWYNVSEHDLGCAHTLQSLHFKPLNISWYILKSPVKYSKMSKLCNVCIDDLHICHYLVLNLVKTQDLSPLVWVFLLASSLSLSLLSCMINCTRPSKGFCYVAGSQPCVFGGESWGKGIVGQCPQCGNHQSQEQSFRWGMGGLQWTFFA